MCIKDILTFNNAYLYQGNENSYLTNLSIDTRTLKPNDTYIGIKEKIIGAYNNNIKKVYIPSLNELDLEEVLTKIKEEIQIILVKNYNEIFEELF